MMYSYYAVILSVVISVQARVEATSTELTQKLEKDVKILESLRDLLEIDNKRVVEVTGENTKSDDGPVPAATKPRGYEDNENEENERAEFKRSKFCRYDKGCFTEEYTVELEPVFKACLLACAKFEAARDNWKAIPPKWKACHDCINNNLGPNCEEKCTW